MSSIEVPVANSFDEEKNQFNEFYAIVRADSNVTYETNKVFLDDLNLAYDVINNLVPNFTPTELEAHTIRLNYLIKILSESGDEHIIDDTTFVLDSFLRQVGARTRMVINDYHSHASGLLMIE
jgi:hypothetical protein